jgi:hypothetical protein
MKKTFFAINILYLVMFAVLPSPSSAIMEGISTEELTRSSDIVVDGDVIDSRAFWSSDGKTIITRAVVRMREVIRGKLVQKRIVVEYDGGEIGQTGLMVSDMATLKKGERVILFLRAGKSRRGGNAFQIVGKGQGKYLIGADNIARKRGFTVLRGRELIDNDIPVDILKDKIRRVR